MMKLEEIGTRARQAEPVLRIMETEKKNRVLKKAAENLVADAETIIAANALDMEHGKEKGMSQGLLDRLFLDKSRIEAMAEGMCQVSELDDPIGEVLGMKKRPNGLLIGQKRVPLGVVGIIYEARPNVTAVCICTLLQNGKCRDFKRRKRCNPLEYGDCCLTAENTEGGAGAGGCAASDRRYFT